MIEECKQTCRKVSYLGRIFDPKVVITRDDVSLKIPSKLSAKDVKKLAMEAQRIYFKDLDHKSAPKNLITAERGGAQQLKDGMEEIKN
jgi:hypothetical protein